ncbi:unnamed protein product [Blepharisma stoltei]|uniref:Uncharacterized protein n=1 Tax=Blepharisma stoltei TaxID=1481888 RepID=A0AAU9JCK1_9CILI|nr:unnamed protein product [Blepharisma stoltei]
MQKVRDVIEKWKNIDDAVEEFKKGWAKSLPRVLDGFKEILDQAEAKWNSPIVDEKVFFTYAERNGHILKEIIRNIDEGSLSLEISPLQESFEKILNCEWNADFSLNKKQFSDLKSFVIKQLSEGLKQLIKILGTSSSHPQILAMTSRLLTTSGFSEQNNKLLKELLKATGNIATDLSFSYIDTHELCEKIIEDLNRLTSSDDVVLGNAKSLRLKKPGNAAQHRRKKIMMRKSISFKLSQVNEAQQASTTNIASIISTLNLFSQYFLSNPIQALPLENLFLVQVPKIPYELVPSYIKSLTLFSLHTNKGKKRVVALLSSLLKNTELRATCRFYLYIINNQLGH